MDIKLKLIKTEYDICVAKNLVCNYHSYVPSYETVGRHIDWLILIDGQIKGMIGIGSATYPPCKDVLTRLNISKEQYKLTFNTIANNWRFCMTEKIPNAGTQILKQLRIQAPKQWYKIYKDDLRYLITFVAGGNNGAVYLADNWEAIGYTAGLPEHKSLSTKWDNKQQLKEKFVKPTGENKKRILFKTLKPLTEKEKLSIDSERLHFKKCVKD